MVMVIVLVALVAICSALVWADQKEKSDNRQALLDNIAFKVMKTTKEKEEFKKLEQAAFDTFYAVAAEDIREIKLGVEDLFLYDDEEELIILDCDEEKEAKALVDFGVPYWKALKIVSNPVTC